MNTENLKKFIRAIVITLAFALALRSRLVVYVIQLKGKDVFVI